jgi:hypothetical protein
MDAFTNVAQDEEQRCKTRSSMQRDERIRCASQLVEKVEKPLLRSIIDLDSD